ncbi:hypothetical protein [Streptomyces carpinensis]|uniref:Uncharacterized protein n=1 Tax=Streptomyces carpinensis TaxID=66369 RepID=A0ABV1W1U2_9ACTN|nr:hypothetical protein [Streptomyces carpinensis]
MSADLDRRRQPGSAPASQTAAGTATHRYRYRHHKEFTAKDAAHPDVPFATFFEHPGYLPQPLLIW